MGTITVYTHWPQRIPGERSTCRSFQFGYRCYQTVASRRSYHARIRKLARSSQLTSDTLLDFAWKSKSGRPLSNLLCPIPWCVFSFDYYDG